MFLSFRKRLKKVCEKQQKVIDKLDVVDLQFSHWIESELAAPPELVEIYNKATDFVNQFDEIIANPPTNSKERKEMKAMILSFEAIFENTLIELDNEQRIAAKKFNELIPKEQRKAAKEPTEQLPKTHKSDILEAYKAARDNIEDIDD